MEDLINKIKSIKKIKLIIILVASIVAISVTMYIANINNQDEDIFIGTDNLENDIEENNTKENSSLENNKKESNVGENIQNSIDSNEIIGNNEIEEESKIIIHIAGEVINNGIVELQEGQRIIDAIEKAGGATAQADLSKVNLAYVLTDGQKVYIPKINENYEGEYVTSESGVAEQKTSNNVQSNKKININTATAEEMQNLQGIGESIAKRIVEYRKENGKFNSIEDIKNVSGIGDAKFNKIKENICVK